MTQKEQVKQHLKEWGKITSWEAIEKYHITRLSDLIFRLRSEGMGIASINTISNGKHFATYEYKGIIDNVRS